MYCHVEFPIKFFDKIVHKRDFLKMIILYKTCKQGCHTLVCTPVRTHSILKWTKISSLEIINFELKNDGKKWPRIYFEIHRAPSELLLPSAKISAQNSLLTTFFYHF